MKFSRYMCVYSIQSSVLMTFSVSTSGAEGIRTPDPLLARQVLSQLSYNPLGLFYFILNCFRFLYTPKLLGLSGLEPPTSRLSGVRSNQLSYKPLKSGIHLLSRAVSSKVPSAD